MNNMRFLRMGMVFLGLTLLLSVLLPVTAAPNQTTRVSVDTNGVEGNQGSDLPSISDNGRFVAFQSFATNLVPGGTSGRQIFVHDRLTKETSLASASSTGVAGNGSSRFAAISANGRFVAFESEASNLVAEDTNNRSDVFVHDRQTKTTILVSLTSDGITQGDGHSLSPAISADGRFVAFYSNSSNFPGSSGNWLVYLKDIQTNQLTLISAAADGTPGDRSAYDPSISADGCVVAFSSRASNLVPNITNILSDIFVYDCRTDSLTRVSVVTGGAESNNDSISPSISADGRFVAFESYATNFAVTDPGSSANIFVHDRQTGITSLVSVASDGTPGNNSSYSPSISADGHLVAFHSVANNLVTEDDNGYSDVFVHNRLTGETVRASVASDGSQGNLESTNPSISGNGRYVAFDSYATNLVPNDQNISSDIFVRGLDYTIMTFLPLVVR